MKTISGKVVSTKPISLSDAANSLTKFAASDHGASHSVSFFIHQAAHSFNQLVHFHDSLTPNFTNNVPKVDEVSQISHKSGVKVESLVKNEGFSNGFQENNKSKNQKVIKNEERVDIGGVEREEFKKNGMEFGEIDGVVSSDKKKKKKKHKGVGDGEVEDQKSINNVERVDIGKGDKEKSEKNEPRGTEGEEVKDDDGMISRDKKKKKKKKNRGVDENEGEVEKVKEDLVVNERKKSKSVDRDASQNDGSTEQSKKKKSKKRSIEGDS